MCAHRAGHRTGVFDQFGKHGLRGARGAWRQQQRGLARPGDARHHRVQPRAAEQPDQQRLAQRAAAQPAHVECVLAPAQQPVLEMQQVGIAAEHQIAVRDQRPQHRKHHRGEHHDHDDDGDAGGHAEPLRGVAPRLGEPRMFKCRTESRLVHDTNRGDDHGKAGEAQWAVAQPGRMPAGQQAAGCSRLISGVAGGSQRVCQQDRAQPRHLFGGHRVEHEHRVARGFLTGADPQHGQPQQLVQQPGVGLNRTNPVARHRHNLALQEAGAQLHLIGLDAVRRGEPPQDAERDGHSQRRDRPHRVARGRSQHDRADQQRKLSQHLMNGMHQQHSRAQPLPHPFGRRCGHVASSAPIAAMSVSWATTRSATSESSATIRTAPADEAVVTVTLAKPNNRSSGPR